MLNLRKILSLVSAVVITVAFSFNANAEVYKKGKDGGFIVPPNAETLFYSGSGNAAWPEGCKSRDERKAKGDACVAGNMEAQAIAILNSFKKKLEDRGWSMEHVVRVNVYAVKGADGKLDFSGFNKGFAKFFDRRNGWYPARTFVEIAALVVPGWLVEVEIVAMKPVE